MPRIYDIIDFMKSKAKVLLEIARDKGIIRAKDLEAYGIPARYLWHFYQEGVLERAGRGLYYLPGQQITDNHSLVEAAQRTPQGVICLLSALQFHELTMQAPYEVWVAITHKGHKPQSEGVQLHIVRFSGLALTAGVEEHYLEGVLVKIYSAAKTVVDCFKYRNKIGIDVAVEALREGLKKGVLRVDELWKYAKICRVTQIIYPYLEALI